MYVKLICVAILSFITLFFFSSQHPTVALSYSDLQTAVGACEAHGSLQEVRCQVTEDLCTSDDQIDCIIEVFHTGCTGVNAPKPEGAGSQNHKEIQCSNSYFQGKCRWSLSLNKCVFGQYVQPSLTCGTKIGAEGC